ncbi:hypothetical protein V6x_41960 [Gimesia chilikensis]|uniref:Hemerythrin-like domain-containing protein n=1 Tax=Gimesia chilikensis TaxID=2605989 RepID=A0A517WGT8_9PLAN|nr:hemerythrin domain-containing protein [Gimesia chilikensis]QDU04468.1 hypothetical protein V6x_41960 [Gimesia chilikensis]
MINNRTRVSINAAFLKEIKDDNLKLYSLLENLRAFCSVDASLILNPEAFSMLVNDFRDQLAMHFTLEETFGYLDLADEVDEIICTKSDRLRKQHIDLYLEIASIADAVQDALYPELNENAYAKQVSRLNDFYHAFQNHEALEFDLIMSVSYDHVRNQQNSNISDYEYSTGASPAVCHYIPDHFRASSRIWK